MKSPTALVLGLIVSISPLLANETVSAPSTEATKATASSTDFSVGLRQLAALGLPDIKAAKWVHADQAEIMIIRSGNTRTMGGLGYSEALYHRGWVLVDAQTGEVKVMLGGSPSFLAIAKPGEQQRDMPEQAKKVWEERQKSALARLKDLPATDLAADVDKLIKELEAAVGKIAKEKEEQKSNNSSWNWAERQQIPINGGILIFATQIYQHGDAALANKLASALFKNFPQKEQSLNAAIALIADEQYADATDTVLASGDWKSYAAQLQTLLKRFPRGWENRAGVEKLFELVEKQVANPPQSLTATEGKSLDPATIAALDALMSRPGKTTSGKSTDAPSLNSELWILPKHAENPEGTSRSVTGSELVRQNARYASRMAMGGFSDERVTSLVNSGMVAIPALATVLTDDNLTLIAQNFHGGDSSYSYFSNRENTGARAARIFESMYRPATRGEVVRLLLLKVLPGEEYKLRRQDAGTLAETALQFWEEHHNNTPLQLIQLYLQEGGSSQKTAALEYLSQSNDPALAAMFEKQALEAENFEGELDNIVTYIKGKRAKAAEFSGKVIERIKKNLSEEKDRPKGEYSSHTTNGVTRLSKQRLESYLSEIEIISGGKSPKVLAQAILTDTSKNVESQFVELIKLMQTLPEEDQGSFLLQCAADSQALRPQLLTMVFYYGAAMRGRLNGRWVGQIEKPTLKPDTEESLLWSKLLADETLLPPKSMFSGLVKTNAQLAAYALEKGYGDMPDYLQMIPSGKMNERILTRAKARLAGHEISAWPDPKKISKERMTAIIDAAAKTPFPELERYIQSLPEDEYIAWMLWTLHHNTSKERAVAMGDVIESVNIPMPTVLAENNQKFLGAAPPVGYFTAEDEVIARRLITDLQLKLGEKVTGEWISAFCGKLAEHASGYSGCIINLLQPQDTGVGVMLGISQGKIESAKLKNQVYLMANAYLSPHAGYLQYVARLFDDEKYKDADALVIPVGSSKMIWTMKDGKVVSPEEAAEKMELKDLYQGTILVLTAKDAKIIRGDEADETEDDEDEEE
ncbi:MAG: hypothetical protein LBV12_00255 [Puniceicoccales bacterium]|jgi:hypothetical protein|nr:hypothetical protein [Puniceicoccales bacterium]